MIDQTTDNAAGQPVSDGTPEELIRHGESCLENGDAVQARNLFEAALQARPDDPRALLGLGRALTARRRYIEADALYRDMETRHIEAIDARLGRARLRWLQGDYAGAKQFYKDVLQADPGNLEARLGIIKASHEMGLDRSALPQANNLVLDHPDSEAARTLKQTITDDLRPRLEFAPTVSSDRGDHRQGGANVAYTFMAEPQSAVRVEFGGARQRDDCGDVATCSLLVQPPPIDGVATTDTQVIAAGLTSRLIRPFSLHGRIGIMGQQDLAGDTREFLFGDGYLHWDMRPELSLHAETARRPLTDSAALVDWGIRVDTASMRVDYRYAPQWTVTGIGELGWYADGNARQTATASVAWQAPATRPHVTLFLEGRLRRFNDDRDLGYLDPRRYDSESIGLRLGDTWGAERLFWRVEGTLGLQGYDPNGFVRAPVASPESPLHGGSATLGAALGGRVDLEMYYARTNDALASDPGFAVRRGGLTLRVRL
jgi:tetratricopeptide (TPR) repeat protein